jgi:hypothetical protein
LNKFLGGLSADISRLMSWEPVGVKLQRVTHADDLNRQMAKLQLMQGQQISKSTGLKSVGIDYEDEVKRMLEEERIYAEEQQRNQEEMEQSQQMQDLSQSGAMGQNMGQAGAGATGQPQPQQQQAGVGQSSAVDHFLMQRKNSPNVPRTPEDLQQQAQLIANQILGQPEPVKDSELIKLKRGDPMMHALVSSVIDDIRQQARLQGGQMIMSEQFGTGGPAQ